MWKCSSSVEFGTTPEMWTSDAPMFLRMNSSVDLTSCLNWPSELQHKLIRCYCCPMHRIIRWLQKYCNSPYMSFDLNNQWETQVLGLFGQPFTPLKNSKLVANFLAYHPYANWTPDDPMSDEMLTSVDQSSKVVKSELWSPDDPTSKTTHIGRVVQ